MLVGFGIWVVMGFTYIVCACCVGGLFLRSRAFSFFVSRLGTPIVHTHVTCGLFLNRYCNGPECLRAESEDPAKKSSKELLT